MKQENTPTGVVVETREIKLEPEYWRDPFSRSLLTVAFAFGVIATLLVFSVRGLSGLILGGLAVIVAVSACMGWVSYKAGCACKEQKEQFVQNEIANGIRPSPAVAVADNV